ncbi:MAG: nitric oxide reductase transcriptional regulator NorR [Planctomycetota bacterium]
MKTTTDVQTTTLSLLPGLRDLAQDLVLTLDPEQRYQRFVVGVQRLLKADAVTLLRTQDEALIPVASLGLADEAHGHAFHISDNPRFSVICKAEEAVRFPADSPLADPFDGLLDGHKGFTSHVHACMGVPLRIGDRLIGVLALDAIAPGTFDKVPIILLDLLAAFATAALRTADLDDALERAAQKQDLIADALLAEGPKPTVRMVGQSEAMSNLLEEIALFAGSDFPVLITGETGAGKELVVQRLHQESTRSAKPLIYVNCAALPESVVESELFGHESGSFTGATHKRLGKFQVADGGCLFLDEIGELPMSVQPKLLRALQSGEIQRVGSDKTHRVSVRVFAATNRVLEKEVEAGHFRSDLLHRLDVCRLVVPPLRARREDIAVLSGHFCDQTRRQLGLGPIRLHPDALEALREFAWPGNVRELENTLSRAVLRASGRVLRGNLILVQRADLGGDFVPANVSEKESASVEVPPVKMETPTSEEAKNEPRPLREAVEDYQRMLIREALLRHDGVWAAAARELGMHRSNLHHLSVRLGIREAAKGKA